VLGPLLPHGYSPLTKYTGKLNRYIPEINRQAAGPNLPWTYSSSNNLYIRHKRKNFDSLFLKKVYGDNGNEMVV